MCTVSMIMDHYTERWTPRLDWPALGSPAFPLVSQEEIAEFRLLLERAREYDKKHNQPDCELDEKRIALKKIAAELGVEITFV